MTLTDEQRRIVEWGEGRLVVIAGAGTGKTKVIVERVKYLLETKGEASGTADPLLPEQLLVLTYNVKAAAELRERIEQAVGVATAARMTVSNFHSFCQRILTENAAEAGCRRARTCSTASARSCSSRTSGRTSRLVYHGTEWWLGSFVQFINRCKDELVTPGRLRCLRRRGARASSRRDTAAIDDRRRPARRSTATCDPLRAVREARTPGRRDQRARRGARARPASTTRDGVDEDRRPRGPPHRSPATGGAHWRGTFAPDDLPAHRRPRRHLRRGWRRARGHAADRARDRSIAPYQDELARRGALDFGEQIAAVAQLFKTRPNVLRRWQRQFRYLLVDEFQDANIAQIELIELLGRTPDRPDNVMVVGDDDQSIYRFRGASFAAFAEFDRALRQAAGARPGRAPRPARRRASASSRTSARSGTC